MILRLREEGVPRGGRRPRDRRRHAADLRRHRRLVLDGVAEALPGEEVQDLDPRRRRPRPRRSTPSTASSKLVTRVHRRPKGGSHGLQRQGPRVATRPSSTGIKEPGLFKEERYIHSPAGRRDRGRVPAPARRRRRSSTSAPTTTSASPATPRSSRPPTRGSTRAATACRRCASSAAPRTSTASSSRS